MRRRSAACLPRRVPRHVAVIGAGPAGLMAAEVLARGGASVTVYDAMPSAGRKFLMAGRGGLNLTHSEPLPQFLARYREAAPRLASRDRSVPAAGIARLERGAGAADVRRLQRAGVSKGVQGIALAARVAARGSMRMGVKFAFRHRWTGWDEQGRLQFQTPDGTRAVEVARDSAGARRRKLAAARLRWRLGGYSCGEGRRDLAAAAGQFRLHRRLVRHLPRPLRGPAAQGRGADDREAHGARRSDRHPQRHRGWRGLRAVGRVARGGAARRAGDAEHRAAARSRRRTN